MRNFFTYSKHSVSKLELRCRDISYFIMIKFSKCRQVDDLYPRKKCTTSESRGTSSWEMHWICCQTTFSTNQPRRRDFPFLEMTREPPLSCTHRCKVAAWFMIATDHLMCVATVNTVSVWLSVTASNGAGTVFLEMRSQNIIVFKSWRQKLWF